MTNELKLQLGEFDIPIRKRPSALYVVLSIIFIAFYFIYWLFITVKDINALEGNDEEDKLNFWLYFSAIFIVAILIGFFQGTVFELAMTIVGIIVNYLISDAILKKMEKYAYAKYNVEFCYNRIAAFFFNFLYVNFAMNDFGYRVKLAKELDGAL